MRPQRASGYSRQRMRIELVLPYLVRGGMETMVSRLARALAARGHEIGVTCTQFGGPLAGDLEAEGIRVTIVPTLGLFTNVRAPQLERWLREVKPDVVHVHSGTWHKSARAAHRAGVPRVIHTVHGLLDVERWHDTLLKRLAARHTDEIVIVSEPLRSFVASQTRRPEAELKLIVNGIDTSRFHPGPRTGALRQRTGIPAAATIIGNVARLQEVKNHELLIDAFSGLLARVTEAHLVVVGEGPLRPSLTEQVRRLGLQRRVHLIGTESDTAPIYREFDLYVLPSRSEGTSMSLLEAMASGIPVIATAVGGTPDLLAHGARGRLVPPDDRHALTRAMREVLADPARHDVAVAARRDVELQYSEAAMVSAYERLYGVADHDPVSEYPAGEAVACAE